VEFVHSERRTKKGNALPRTNAQFTEKEADSHSDPLTNPHPLRRHDSPGRAQLVWTLLVAGIVALVTLHQMTHSGGAKRDILSEPMPFKGANPAPMDPPLH
jgi:hypothetical protein